MLFSLLLLAAQPADLPPGTPDADDASVAGSADGDVVPPASPPPGDWEKRLDADRQVRDPVTGEIPVKPYIQSNANAGARPFEGTAMAATFGGQPGIRRIADRVVELSRKDPRIADIFVNQDMVRLRRTLFEQFCYILNAGCDYTGRDMAASHKDMGIRMADLNALVEHLQHAMREQHVPFAAQNRLLAKLAPMDRDVIQP